jgi:hypothetical protein
MIAMTIFISHLVAGLAHYTNAGLAWRYSSRPAIYPSADPKRRATAVNGSRACEISYTRIGAAPT